MSTPDPSLVWLQRMRWGTLLGQGMAVAAAPLALGVSPSWGCAPLLALRLMTHLRTTPLRTTALLAFDIATLTALLAMAGGTSNPFGALYLAEVALAAVAVTPRHAAALATFATAGYGLLFWTSDPHAMHAMGDAAMRGHLVGMWAALAVTGGLIAAFVANLARALRDRDEALAEERRRLADAARLAALGTLAAGAAHELGSPLGAIALAADDLARSTGHDDAEFIRDQVRRCRDVLADLSFGAGQSVGEPPEPIRVSALIARLPSAEQARVRTDGDATVQVPPRAAARVLASLIRNGLAASPADAPVTVHAKTSADRVEIIVSDRGAGMPPDVLRHAGEPFFTTRPPGQGMGLGLYLARGFAESLGGTLTIASTPGAGTQVTLRL
jgi:two-component system sensor histidine kinase RegB